MIVDLERTHRCLSWAPARPGFVTASKVAWLFLEIDELRPVEDPVEWFHARLREQSLEDAVGLMTSRRRHQYSLAEAGVCRSLATVGLSNALAAGDPAAPGAQCRTINILCTVSTPLSDAALVEAVALVAEARAAVLIESGCRSVVSGNPATGTGTDCIVVASAQSDAASEPWCGKHTAIGEQIGRAVRQAVSDGVTRWRREFTR